jgi:Bacterial Ig domain/Putative peptidoglycan binding domain/Abnormal spindle-like microcephaly-assoc'd, ASPM-SPD-2-Hydin
MKRITLQRVGIMIVLALAIIIPAHSAFAQSAPSGPDNKYCLPGNIPEFGTSDGPAQLPENCFYTALSATPSPGSVVSVPVSSTRPAIQTIVNNLQCGQTLQFQAGASYDVSNLTFPAKNCSSNDWITVETSDYNQLPPEGTRISPCWAGVASLPGRPAYACPANGPEDVMAQLTLDPDTNISVPGDHYRFIGLEVTRTPGLTGVVYEIFEDEYGSNIIFDRDWIHGDATHETQHAIQNDDANHIALIDSYVNDMHCIANGACGDSQDFSGGNDKNVGDTGVFKIVDNFLEASGENIIFGGEGSVDTPADIEVRSNYFFKPQTWNPSSTSYFGTEFIVKNLFELKNAQRVLLEGNVMQNSWGGFTQVGPAIVFTPKNQVSATGTYLCPLCQVKNITVRYNDVSNVGQPLQISTGENGATAPNSFATAGNSYSIHDDIFDGISYPTCFGCASYQDEISEGGWATSTPPSTDILHDVDINHITEVTDLLSTTKGGFLELGALNTSTFPQLPYNITINNSIFYAGYWGPWSIGGGTTDCAWAENSPLAKFNACWASYSFAGNVLAGGLTIGQTPTWPSGNFFPTSQASIGFTNLDGGVGGDYTLAPGSAYKGAATDGTDPGANIALVDSYTAGDLLGNGSGGTVTQEPPTVSVTSPVPSATLFGTVTLSANATAGTYPLSSVQFEVDGSLVGSALSSAPYTYSLNTLTLTNGPHTISAEVKDTSGDVVISQSVSVTVNNAASTGTPASGTLSLSASSLTFGSITVGTSSPTQRITLTNNTAQSVTLTNLTIAPPFLIPTNYCVANTTWNGSIAPDTHCDMYVEFTPQVDGASTGTLSFSAGGMSFEASLTGTGTGEVTGGGGSGGGSSSGGGTTTGGGSSGTGSSGSSGGGSVSVPSSGTTSTSTPASLESLLQSLIAELDSLIAQENTVIVSQLSQNLMVGDINNQVSLLQEFLDYNGYPVSTTGIGSLGNLGTYFGTKTQAALAQFQAASGLPSTGFFGPLTRQYLEGKW